MRTAFFGIRHNVTFLKRRFQPLSTRVEHVTKPIRHQNAANQFSLINSLINPLLERQPSAGRPATFYQCTSAMGDRSYLPLGTVFHGAGSVAKSVSIQIRRYDSFGMIITKGYLLSCSNGIASSAAKREEIELY